MSVATLRVATATSSPNEPAGIPRVRRLSDRLVAARRPFGAAARVADWSTPWVAADELGSHCDESSSPPTASSAR